MSLFWKVFASFLATLVAVVGLSVFASVRYVEDRASQLASMDRTVIIDAVEDALQDGPDGFRDWLRRDAPLPPDRTIYLIDRDGADILGRRLPREIAGLYRRLQRTGRVRRAMVGNSVRDPSGEPYLYALGPVRPPRLGPLGVPGMHRNILLTTLAVSAFACFLLTRYLTAPIRAMTRSAEALGAGRLDERAGPLGRRRDEIGTLARRFDAMADSLQQEMRSRDELLRNVSHELRSPLARIEVALALADRDPSKTGEQLDRIARESAHMERLTAQVLALARAGSAPEAERSRFAVGDWLEAVVADARFEAAPENIRIETSIDAGSGEITARRELLHSALENVVRNAVRYSPAGARVCVSARRDDADVVVRVDDAGPGVPEDQLPHLFEPFYSTEAGHSGVGLALTAQVLALHGGSISASAGASGGLSVTLRLPAE